MNADHMIDYVLGQLDGPDRERMEHAIETDPDVAARVERLGRAIHLLLDDGEAIEPPPGLARSTLALVAQSRSKPRSILDYVPARVPFRWADFAVAASIFIAGVLTLVPAIQRSRERMRQAGCVFNLQQLGQSLAQYASLHPFYPYPPSQQADAHAGTFAAVASRCRRTSRPLDPGLSLQRPLPGSSRRPSQLRPAQADSPLRSRPVSPHDVLGLRL